jgi:hypothetical protein
MPLSKHEDASSKDKAEAAEPDEVAAPAPHQPVVGPSNSFSGGIGLGRAPTDYLLRHKLVECFGSSLAHSPGLDAPVCAFDTEGVFPWFGALSW